MLYSTVETAAPALWQLIGRAEDRQRHVLLISHVNPDGDAVGSLTGMGLALEALGHRVTLLSPTPPPPYVTGMPAVDRIQVYATGSELPDVDLVLLVDTGDVGRIGRIWNEAHAYLQARPLAVIDHHVTNSGEGVVNYVDPSRSSTCELIYDLLRAWNIPITPPLATALLLGVVTDTQSFRTSNTTPSALRTGADLLAFGGDHARIVKQIYHNVPVGTARLLSLALEAMRHDDDLVWTRVSLAMQVASGADDDAYSEVTDYLSSLGGFRASMLLKERGPREVKVSFRSVPGVDVSVVARQFGGGGHRQAAGCTIMAPLDEAETLALAALRGVLTHPS